MNGTREHGHHGHDGSQKSAKTIIMSKTAKEKIAEYRTYKDGWRWGEGVAFSDLVVNNAALLNEKARSVGMAKTDCFPSTDGTLQIAIYAEQRLRNWFFDAEPDGSIYWFEEILDIEDEGKTTIDVALKMIEEIGNKYGSVARGRANRED